jgi:hypothetical protein
MKVETLGSLKCPREAGCPDKLIGTSGEHWRSKISSLIFDPQGPHHAFKRSPNAISISYFIRFELSEVSVNSVRDRDLRGEFQGGTYNA